MRRRVLLLLKPLDVFPPRPNHAATRSPSNPKVLRYLDDRCRVHKKTIRICQDVLQRKLVDWEPVMRNDLSQSINHVDLVVSVGGDGTLLQASHFMDGSIPIVGVNSDPTQASEVEESSNEYDATRSTGYLCAATAGNFEQVIDEILGSHRVPSELSRIAIKVNGILLPTYALNDILVAHPCPASVSRFSLRLVNEDGKASYLVNCRSSGLRVCTAAGSTAAMQSAGGYPMPILSNDLQYIVREPILPRPTDAHLMHSSIRFDQLMQASWYTKEGTIYIDGSHVFYSVQHGDALELSSKAPVLKVYLPRSLL